MSFLSVCVGGWFHWGPGPTTTITRLQDHSAPLITCLSCRTMDCTIDAVEGCDQRTLESLSEAPGVTIEDMKDAYHQMCPSGN